MPKTSPQARKLRRRLGLTQLQLASLAGLASRTVQLAESGKDVSERTIERLSLALKVTPDQIVSQTAESPVDGYQDLPWSVGNRLRQNMRPNAGSMCTNVDEVCRVVGQMRDEFRSQLAHCIDPCEQAKFESLDDQINAAYFRYENHYVELFKHVPESIMVDRHQGQVAGVSVVVPLKAESYKAICRGEKSFVDIGGQDLQPQSQYLLIDSVTEFAQRATRPWYQMTQSLSFVTFSQIAKLSVAPQREDFEMVSFFASGLNRKRLMAAGFVPQEITMPEFGFGICRFGDAIIDDRDHRYAVTTTWTHFAKLTKNLSSVSVKQSMLKRFFQWIKRRQNVVDDAVLAA